MTSKAGRRYDDQMMLIERGARCAELRALADYFDMSDAELLREIVAHALPGLRKRRRTMADELAASDEQTRANHAARLAARQAARTNGRRAAATARRMMTTRENGSSGA